MEKRPVLLADPNGLQWLEDPAARPCVRTESGDRTERGFSLVEVLVAAGLVSFLLVGTAEILVQSIGLQRKTDRTLRIAGLLASEAERAKSLPFEADDLAAGRHEIEVELQPGEPIRVEWEVGAEGTNLKRVNFTLSRNGGPERPLEAVLLISKDLGF
jgi:prepilin-type N-terminal cleavage/methylation domain-containing protein